VGDTVEYDSANPDSLFLRRLATEDRPGSELRLVTSRTGYIGEELDVLTPISSGTGLCGGFTACGAFTAPAYVSVASTQLYAGEETTGRLFGGRQYRIAIGKAVETVVGVDGCSRNEREPGMEINAVMRIEEVE
jgi:hypothetical protein